MQKYADVRDGAVFQIIVSDTPPQGAPGSTILPVINADWSRFDGRYAFAEALTYTVGTDAVTEALTVSYRADTRDILKALVDEDAEAARGRWITLGSGQAMTYLRKETQAREVLASYSATALPPAGAYLFLEATLGIDGETVFEVAQTVVARADAWATIGPDIERIRQQAKQTLDGLTDTAAQVAHYQSLSWPVA